MLVKLVLSFQYASLPLAARGMIICRSMKVRRLILTVDKINSPRAPRREGQASGTLLVSIIECEIDWV